MKLIDVTLRENYDHLTYEQAMDYLQHLVKYVSHQDLQRVEYVYLNNDKHGDLCYDEDYIIQGGKILDDAGFERVGMIHPGRVDLSRWNPDLIKPFSLIRIVCQDNEVPEIVGDYIRFIHKCGSKASVNIAYVMNKSDELIIEMYEKALSFGADYVYFADSCGSATVYDISHLCSILKAKRKENKIGFHLHNQFGLAMANAIQIQREGIDSSDVSITGLGKGAGNLCMELFIPVIRHLTGSKVDAQILKNFIDFIDYFNKLIGRTNDNHKEAIINLPQGMFKMKSAKVNQYMKEIGRDPYKYIDLVYSNL